jgi:hypothetical protein
VVALALAARNHGAGTDEKVFFFENLKKVSKFFGFFFHDFNFFETFGDGRSWSSTDSSRRRAPLLVVTGSFLRACPAGRRPPQPPPPTDGGS